MISGLSFSILGGFRGDFKLDFPKFESSDFYC